MSVFTEDEETGIERLSNLPNVTQLIGELGYNPRGPATARGQRLQALPHCEICLPTRAHHTFAEGLGR